MPRGYAKVPVVIQMEALECGAASLAMVLAYYGKWLPLEQVRADCGVSRDGSKALNLLRAARSYGLEASAYRYDTVEALRGVPTPCILFWNFNHFVVLDGFKGHMAVLNDPARGVVAVGMEEFDKAFTGICLHFKPAADFRPSGKRRSVWEFARSRLRGALMPFLFVLATGGLTAGLGVIYPAFSRVFLDRLLSGRNPEWLYPFIGLMAAAVVLTAVVTGIRTLYMLKISGKLAITANASFMWHVLRLPMAFFSQRMAGDIANRQASNAGIAMTLINQLAPVVLNLGMMVFYLIVMLRYSLILTAVGLFCAAFNMYMAQAISKKRINLSRTQMRDAGKLSGTLVSGIEMIETIKATGAEEGYFARWAGYQAAVNEATVRFSQINQYLGAVPGVVQALANIAVLMLSVALVMKGQFTIGMILAFQGFMSSFLSPMNSLINVTQKVQEMRTSMERIEDVMNCKPDVDYADTEPGDDRSWAKLFGSLEMRGVTFGYSKFSPPLIENFSLKLEPGAKVAFVGPSGCGKSTLSKLISGLYKPWSGEILLGGIPIGQIPREILTGSLAVVDQDIILFEDTISANIKMWDSSIEDFEMILAARDSRLHEDIMQREGGYGYKILEDGRDFSGGQRQCFEIARVLAQDPTVIIMDEATSALDARTEAEVVSNIKDRGITCVVIAHRLSTIRDCDEIVVLNNGKVAERGTHEDLYANNGLYTQLVATE